MSLDVDFSTSLRPMDVARYARHSDWETVAAKGRMYLFRHKFDRLRQVQVPKDADDPGWRDALQEAVQRFAELEKRAPEAVLEDLQSGESDVLRFRVTSADTRGGQLSMWADLSLREGVRRALLSAACSVVSPSTFHARMSRVEADSLLSKCRAGQTEIGSYVVKIVCPLHIDGEAPTPSSGESFTRRVTKLLMKSLTDLVSVIEAGEEMFDEFIDTQQQHPLISANLCEAVMRMQPNDTNGRVDISSSWASGHPRPESVPGLVSVKSEYFPFIGDIASRLRPASLHATADWIIGSVEALGGEVGPDGRRAGDVTLTLLMPESDERVRARVNLDSDQYAAAVAAHSAGHAYVRVRGSFHKGAKISRISPVLGFERILAST